MTLQIDKPKPNNNEDSAKFCAICKLQFVGKDFDAYPICVGRCCEDCFVFYVNHAKTLQQILKKLRDRVDES